MRILIIVVIIGQMTKEEIPCESHRKGQMLNVDELVGTWLTVYTQPKSMDCFSLHIRAITDLERDQYMMKFGNISDTVDWSQCFLEVLSPLGKHYLQGDGSNCGILENIILVENEQGDYTLFEQRPNQWLVFGRRGEEVLVMRDYGGSAAAAFVRAPFWPTGGHLHAILHRSGVICVSNDHSVCDPERFIQKSINLNSEAD